MWEEFQKDLDHSLVGGAAVWAVFHHDPALNYNPNPANHERVKIDSNPGAVVRVSASPTLVQRSLFRAPDCRVETIDQVSVSSHDNKAVAAGLYMAVSDFLPNKLVIRADRQNEPDYHYPRVFRSVLQMAAQIDMLEPYIPIEQPENLHLQTVGELQAGLIAKNPWLAYGKPTEAELDS